MGCWLFVSFCDWFDLLNLLISGMLNTRRSLVIIQSTGMVIIMLLFLRLGWLRVLSELVYVSLGACRGWNTFRHCSDLVWAYQVHGAQRASRVVHCKGSKKSYSASWSVIMQLRLIGLFGWNDIYSYFSFLFLPGLASQALWECRFF